MVYMWCFGLAEVHEILIVSLSSSFARTLSHLALSNLASAPRTGLYRAMLNQRGCLVTCGYLLLAAVSHSSITSERSSFSTNVVEAPQIMVCRLF